MHDPAAANGAAHQAGEQIARAATFPVAGRLAGAAASLKRALARLHMLPQVLIDHPQRRHILNDPSGVRIEPRHPRASSRVLHVAQAVPDQPADIELVVEDAGAAQAVAVDGARPPCPARRAGYAFGIQPFCNRTRRDAGGVILEDAADDSRLLRIDSAFACQWLSVRTG